MKAYTFFFSIALLVLAISSCTSTIGIKKYPEQIGDTEFNKKMDNPDFKFCNPSNVLHKRALIVYKNGFRDFERNLISLYHFDEDYKNFTGYFFIRFAVNCKNETDRFRWQVVDSEFKKTSCPKKLQRHLIDILKKMRGWQHPKLDEESSGGR